MFVAFCLINVFHYVLTFVNFLEIYEQRAVIKNLALWATAHYMCETDGDGLSERENYNHMFHNIISGDHHHN